MCDSDDEDLSKNFTELEDLSNSSIESERDTRNVRKLDKILLKKGKTFIWKHYNKDPLPDYFYRYYGGKCFLIRRQQRRNQIKKEYHSKIRRKLRFLVKTGIIYTNENNKKVRYR